jgi:acylphosphatase
MTERDHVSDAVAARATVRGEVQGVGFRDATRRGARELGLMGWVRNGEENEVLVHAEGVGRSIDELLALLWQPMPRAPDHHPRHVPHRLDDAFVFSESFLQMAREDC